jgi:hypothetical protein
MGEPILIDEDITERGEMAPELSVFSTDGALWISQIESDPLRVHMVGMSREQARKVRDALNRLLEPFPTPTPHSGEE